MGDRVTVEDDRGTPAPPRIVVGQVLGRYRIDAILGTGGMGIVARARDLDLDRDVALKVAVRASHDRGRAEQLLREAQAMARLRMRNVRAVHDVGSANGIDYVAMEYIAGVDLAAWLAAPHGPAEIVRVFVEAGRGLAAAHAAGIVHRDVKPSNVLVGDDGSVVVTDFGIARWLHDDGEAVAGTPAYRAPEAELDERSDQYSFATALGEAAAALPAPLRRAIERIAARGRAADPAQRYPSMIALVDALEATRRRSRWPFAAAAVTVLALAAIAFAVLRDPADDHAGPSTAQLAAQFAARPVDELLASAHGLADRGYFRSARAAATAANELATARVPDRRAAAAYELGRTALREDDVDAARTAFGTAAQLADAARDDALRARALLGLFEIAATRGSDRAAAERAEHAASAALARSSDRDARAELRFYQGTVAADAAERSRAFVEARDLVGAPSPGNLVLWCEIVRGQAHDARAAGKLADAIALHREVVATADRIAGSDHMAAISARGDLAVALELAGQLADADATMTELRGAGRTPAGARLLAETDAAAPVPTRRLDVTVRDAAGAPVVGAMVVAAATFHANAYSLLGASSLYVERENRTTVATTDELGVAHLAIPRGVHLWLGAEHRTAGRAASILVSDGDRAELALAPWAPLAITASDDDAARGVARIIDASVLATVERDTTLDWRAPSIDLGPGSFAPYRAPATPRDAMQPTVGRIPRGHYLAARCVRRADVEMCRARHAEFPAAQPVDLGVGSGSGSLVVRPRDELGRPIESTFVILGPPSYRPAQLRAIEVGWVRVLADQPDAIIASTLVHGAASARFEHIPVGRYNVCSAALHGDTDDPSFVARFETRRPTAPVFCTAVTVGSATTYDLVIPAAQRVWLGDPPAVP